jgi:hypothetical protein
MIPICERCGKKYEPVYDYETWKYPETRNYHLCPACFQEDVDVLTEVVLHGEKLISLMGYGKLRRP